MVLPLGAGDDQKLVLVEKGEDDHVRTSELIAVGFSPLIASNYRIGAPRPTSVSDLEQRMDRVSRAHSCSIDTIFLLFPKASVEPSQQPEGVDPYEHCHGDRKDRDR